MPPTPWGWPSMRVGAVNGAAQRTSETSGKMGGHYHARHRQLTG
jgi:hypothetical protein